MPGIPRPILHRPVGQEPIGFVLAALQHGLCAVGGGHRAAQRIGVLVGHGFGAAADRAAALGDQAAAQVDVLAAFAGSFVALEQDLAGLAVEAVGQAGAAAGPNPSAMGVVAVGLRAAGPQAVAVVERVGHAVLVGQVALDVIAQADHGGAAAAAAGHDVGELVGGVVAVVVVARLAAAGDLDVGQVVDGVVGVAGGAEHRRGRLHQPVQVVVDHVAVAAVAGDPVADGQHVAVGVVVDAVVVDGGAAVGVAAALGQAAGILGQGVDDAVAIGEPGDGAVGVVGDAGGVAPGLGGLAQGVGGIAHRQAVGIGQAGQVAVAGVAVAHGPGVGVGLEGLGHGQAALVVEIAVGDAAGAAVVVRGDAFGQAVGGVVPGLVAVVVREGERVDAVARIVGAHDLAGQDGGGVAGGAAGGLSVYPLHNFTPASPPAPPCT